LPAVAHDYGFFETLKVSRESLVNLATNRYSVPVRLVGQLLTVRIHPTRLALYAGDTLVATHPRQFGRHQRVVIPEHYEPVFARKPRARVMAYRDWLVQLSPLAADYVSQVCRARYAAMEHEMVTLYQLAQQAGVAAFLAAIALAVEAQTVGAEYVQAILAQPQALPPPRRQVQPVGLPAALQRPQAAVARDLADYEQYVANRSLVAGGAQ
jgi:hypothetical protein